MNDSEKSANAVGFRRECETRGARENCEKCENCENCKNCAAGDDGSAAASKIRSITLRAPAKINLFIEVTGKRDDGYHEIDSVMTLSEQLFDTVTVRKNEVGGLSVSCRAASCRSPEDINLLGEKDNIAYRAAEAFLNEARTRGILGADDFCGFEIEIDKRIPVRAGLGGGSADAAAVLLGMNVLGGSPFSNAELQKIGLALGADVPFCVSCEKFALCGGVGERLAPIAASCALRGIITCERDKKSSTKDAYGKIDSMSGAGEKEIRKTRNIREIKSSKGLVSALVAGDGEKAASELYNVFDTVCGYGREAREILEKHGGVSCLSGAGPAVFAVFFDSKRQAAAERELEMSGFDVYNF